MGNSKSKGRLTLEKEIVTRKSFVAEILGEESPEHRYEIVSSYDQTDSEILHPSSRLKRFVSKRFRNNNIEEEARHRMTVQDFETIKILGKGSLGTVTLVRSKEDQKLYAMKAISKQLLRERNIVRRAQSERDVLRATAHTFLVNLHWTFQTKKSLFFILDYCPGGELAYHLKKVYRFSQQVAKHYAAEIVLAIEHLHRHGIIYRDLKPENILLSETGHVKLIDFGLAKFGINHANRGTNTLCGSFEYLAPEVLSGKEYGNAADWWSFGAVLYELLTGLPPWYTTDTKEMRRRLANERLHLPAYLSSDAVSILRALLLVQPQERLGTRRGSSEIKHHAFFSDVDWEQIENKADRSPIQPCPTVDSINKALNFDPEFTTLPIETGSELEPQSPFHDDEFTGFSFEASTALSGDDNNAFH